MEMGNLRSRLASPQAGIRRVAVLDLVRLSAEDRQATGVLVGHLPRERDEKAALAIIRHLARAGYQEALPILWGLYENPVTSAGIAHAAINAHDHLLWLKRGEGQTLESARDHTRSHSLRNADAKQDE